MSIDSAFARLAEAWNATKRGANVFELARRLAQHAGLAADNRDSVLWLTADSRSPAPPPAVTSLAEGHRNFRITRICPRLDEDLETLLRKQRPRLLVAEVGWCAQAGTAAIKRLHRHAPQVDWLLCWDEPSPRWLETLVHSGARGAVTHSADPNELARAFDAVVAGEVWLPRRVLQWLYATLVEPPGNEAASTTPSSIWPGDSQLTPREAEVVMLVRQGLTNREIGVRLGVSVNTVKKHVASAYEKHGIRSRRQTLR